MTDNKLVRVQLRRTKGWRMPENTVKVSRPTRWGNPYRIINEEGFPLIEGPDGRCMNTRGEDATNWHNCHRHAVALFRDRCVDALPNLEVLRGKNLACFCPLDEPCHADVLLALANVTKESI